MLGLGIQQRWRNESGRQASALSLLSVFGGNFVLAMPRLGRSFDIRLNAG